MGAKRFSLASRLREANRFGLFAALLVFLSLLLPWYTLYLSFLAADQAVKLDIFVWGATGPYGTVMWIELASQTGLVEWLITFALPGPVLLGGTLSLIGAFRRVKWISAFGGILTLLEAAVSYFVISWIIKRGLWAGTAGSIVINPDSGFFVALISGTISIVSVLFQQAKKVDM